MLERKRIIKDVVSQVRSGMGNPSSECGATDIRRLTYEALLKHDGVGFVRDPDTHMGTIPDPNDPRTDQLWGELQEYSELFG